MRLLAEGKFTEAWPLFEARRRFSKPAIFEPQVFGPEWAGEDLAGKTITVAAEQGFGDQMMFGRYLPILRQRGARIIVACHPLVAPVFGQAGFSTTTLYTDAPLPPSDYWLMIGSLPYRLGLSHPPPPVYLNVSLGGGGGGGVMTVGSPLLGNDANRSLPPAAGQRLASIGRLMSPDVTGAKDFMETAAIVAGLDLVVTVDTALAHLAGAMGKPCWVLLPHDRLDWRWGVSGAYSRWYPTMRLYRQPSPGDWTSVLDRVIHDTRALAPLWAEQHAAVN
jgi:hypothetical protein